MIQSDDISIFSLRGGLNVQDPPSALLKDQCVVAENVVFDEATVGARRLGCTAINTSTVFAGMTEVVFVHRHLPTDDQTAAQLWVLASDGATVVLAYKDTTWHVVTPADAIDVNYRYDVRAQTLHNNLFMCYRSTGGVDRMHVWDGTNLRKTGISQPAAPTVTNGGGAGTYAGTRYFRVRYTKQVAGVTVLRSEPSTATTFSPSGTNAGAINTRGALLSEGETHWEIEGSTDNDLFYRIATIAIGTTASLAENTDYVVGYAEAGVLSEDIGDYDLLHSARVVSADQDRLMLAGSFEQTALSSRVAWTPVFNAPGVGNDERSPIDEDNFVDLDTSEGGRITDMSKTVNGYVAVFKLTNIYRMVRTGLRARAYDSIKISTDRGALPGTVVEAVDQGGSPALYFLDPRVGPCRLGVTGLKTCGYDIQKIWDTVNVNATVVGRGVYYPRRRQIRWCVATAGAVKPNLMIILQINETRDTDDGVRRGWSTATGASATALCMTTFAENIDDGVARSLKLKPVFGITATNLLQLGDTGDTDNGATYVGDAVSGPMLPVGLMAQFGVRAAAVLAKAADSDVSVELIRNFGKETSAPFTVNLAAVGTEGEDIVRPLDNAKLSEVTALQVRVTDGPSGNGWHVNAVALKPRQEAQP